MMLMSIDRYPKSILCSQLQPASPDVLRSRFACDVVLPRQQEARQGVIREALAQVGRRLRLGGHFDDATDVFEALDLMAKFEGNLYAGQYKQVEDQLRWLVASPFDKTQELLDVTTAAAVALEQMKVVTNQQAGRTGKAGEEEEQQQEDEPFETSKGEQEGKVDEAEIDQDL
jgi:hypothetical protein